MPPIFAYPFGVGGGVRGKLVGRVNSVGELVQVGGGGGVNQWRGVGKSVEGGGVNHWVGGKSLGGGGGGG